MVTLGQVDYPRLPMNGGGRVGQRRVLRLIWVS